MKEHIIHISYNLWSMIIISPFNFTYLMWQQGWEPEAFYFMERAKKKYSNSTVSISAQNTAVRSH